MGIAMSHISRAKKRMARPMAAAATAAMAVASTAVVFATSPSAQAQEACPAVEVIQVQGTSGSSENKDPKELRSMYPNYNLAQRLVDKYPGQVRAWDVPYPSSISTLFSVIQANVPGQPTTSEHTYGQSVQMGVDWANNRMAQTASACPNTKFVITGYSQGASVAGNVATAVANDFVKGVTSDKIVGVVLFADPSRSGNSQYDSWESTTTLYNQVPPGKMQKNLEIVAPDAEDNAVGWAGPRNLPMKGLYGKVLSLCDANDIACTVAPDSMLRDIADTANLTTNATVNSEISQRISKGVAHFMNNGGVEALTTLNFPRAAELFGQAVGVAQLSLQDLGVASQLVNEVGGLANILLGAKGFGADVDGGALANLGTVFRGFLTTGAESIADTFNLPVDTVRDMIDRFGFADTLGDDNHWSQLGAQFGAFSGFPMAHASYWNTNKIEGIPAADWAYNWIETGVGNAINGKTFTYTPQGKVGSQYEDTAQPTVQNDGDKTPEVSGEKQNNPTPSPAPRPEADGSVNETGNTAAPKPLPQNTENRDEKAVNGVVINDRGEVVTAKGSVLRSDGKVDVFDKDGNYVGTGVVKVDQKNGEVTIVDENGHVIAKGGAVRDASGRTAVVDFKGNLISVIGDAVATPDNETAAEQPAEAENEQVGEAKTQRTALASTGSEIGGVAGASLVISALVGAAITSRRKRSSNEDAAVLV